MSLKYIKRSLFYISDAKSQLLLTEPIFGNKIFLRCTGKCMREELDALTENDSVLVQVALCQVQLRTNVQFE